MNSEIYRKNSQAQLKDLRSKINGIEAELIADETTSARRGILLDELEDHQLKRGELASEIRELELEAAELQGAYQVLLDQYEIY
ncbi:MAG: hypothetical protein ABGY96_12855 [bacterium]|nr:hypothetical protein [Gammaproteobacteria bacterium]HIL97868.1 hypothetical protein [Pseudomonadales bacterium]